MSSIGLLVKSSLVAAAVLLISAAEITAAERPNILWIIADDLSPELGCYGYEGVNTPRIDNLAEEGTRYTAAFATSPVCSSSRSAFITGVYQTTTGSHHHRTHNMKPLPGSIVPITELLRDAGYYVCNSNSAMTRPGKSDYNFAFDGEVFDGAEWSKRKPGQPFFAQVQIHEPHRKFNNASAEVRNRDFKIPAYYPEHPIIRADWANYLATVEVLDEKVGKVLDRLDKEGLTENTVVIFFGDHGRPHYRDKQWLYDGGLRVPLIIRCPKHINAGAVNDELVSLIDVSAATVKLAGLDVPDWMQGRDLLSDDFQGRDMIFAARDRCGSTVDRIRCVRTEQYKYIRNFYPDKPYWQHSDYKELGYPGMTLGRVLKQRGELTGPHAAFWADHRPAEELYDLKADPEELHNLAADPDYQDKLAKLRSDLDHWMIETNDQGGQPETGLEELKATKDTWFERTMKKRGLSTSTTSEEYLQWWSKELGVAE
ncbi:sulfatase family protein [Calycomorphotria hydatis]|uniref:Arylsulfatase n=1 Tax=Calycomorphotria hydatis TaxID=2528027 RepID=A0A517TBM4_9PLAN|nr:sulfatase [Calycomorphotria hydatis]QDT65769.1 Arylsulfatase [Calycomorphotria hydatis]